MKEQYLQKQNTPFFKDQFDVKPHLYLHFERKFYHPGLIKKGYLLSHLQAQRVKFNMSVTHLAMILSCSRPQYLRTESGENRFKDEQLETLAALYGDDVSTYKDMQDVDLLLKKIGYYDNPERAVYLLEMALKAITIPSIDDNSEERLSPEVPEKLFNIQTVSKEFQQQNLAKIIERLQLRFQQNDSKMTEIGEKIAPMANAPNPEKTKLWQEYHLIEDEQSSIEKLISKLKGWVK